MKKRVLLLFSISIMAILGGSILNFREFINDYWPVNTKNVIVTVAYIIIWVIVLSISFKYKYFRTVKIYSVFWFITLVHTILLILCNTGRFNMGWVILTAIPFLCPWYGLTFCIEDNVNAYILIAAYSLSIIIINDFFIRANSRLKHL